MGLRSWRIPSQSSPNISETVFKEFYPLLQRNALTPWRGLRSKSEDGEQDIGRWKTISPSLSSLTCLEESPKPMVTFSHAHPCLSRTLSIPETSSNSISSGLSSITITARRVSLSGDLSSQESRPVDHLETLPLSSTSAVSLSNDKEVKMNMPSNSPVTLRHKTKIVKVSKDKERYRTSETFAANQPPPERSHSYTDSGTTSRTLTKSLTECNESCSSLLVSKGPIFRSCAQLDLLPCPSTRSNLYLDKSLSITFRGARGDIKAMHRSTLSLYLEGAILSSRPKKLQKNKAPFRSSSEWNMVDFTQETREQSQSPEDTTTVNFGPSKSDLTIARVTVAPLPFRSRCLSASPVVRQNGKANDVSGPQQSNQRGGVEGPVNSRGSVEACNNGRVPCAHAETVTKVQECLVSPHMLPCTCGPNSSIQPQLLSLKEALELFRPDFISRSQRRVQQLEQKARKRRSLQDANFTRSMESTYRMRNCTKPLPLSDNLFKPRDRVISGKEMQLRSRRIYNKLPEVTKKKEEENKRLVLQTNRLRAEVFKKKLLDQILQRNSD